MDWLSLHVDSVSLLIVLVLGLVLLCAGFICCGGVSKLSGPAGWKFERVAASVGE